MLIAWIILFPAIVHAQSKIGIHGIVRDSASGAVLEEATVLLFRLPAGTMVAQALSNKEGFAFRSVKRGNYRLVTSYLGYLTDSMNVFVKGGDTAAIYTDVKMRQSGQALAEVVVKSGIPPAIVRNDTIAFNAGAYALHPNSTVEDLLKKLPGVDVDKDGNVTMQGKKVDKIYIDGKEFFLGDIRTATRNLPSDIVAQIETYDTQSEQAKLTGIKGNSTTKTINVKLKKDRKVGYFGRLYAGTGNGNTYSAGTTVNSMAPKRWLYFDANTNNVNNQFPPNDFGRPNGAPGIQTLGTATFNYRQEWSKKITTVVNANYNSSQTSLLQTGNKQTFLSDSSLVENRLTQSNSKNHSFRLGGFVDYKPDSVTFIQLRTNYSPGKNSSGSLDTVAVQTLAHSNSYISNRGETDNSSQSNSYNFNNALDLRRGFQKKGRTIYLGLTSNIQHQDQPAALYSLVNNYDSTGAIYQQNIQNQRSTQVSSGNSYGANLAFTEPISPQHILDFNYQVTSSVSRTDKNSLAYDSATGKYDIVDTTTTNHFKTLNLIQRVGVGYNVNNPNLSYQIGLAAQFSNLDNNNYTLKDRIVQRFTNWYPRAYLMKTLGKGRNINFEYNGSNTTPTIDQLQPLPDLTNPFLVRIGNPDLKQQFDHSLSARFVDFNSTNFRNLQFSMDGSLTENKITSATTILAGGIQQLQFVNTNGNYRFGSSITYGFPLGSQSISKKNGNDQRRGNANLSANMSYSRDVSLLNGEQNITNSTNLGGHAGINYHIDEKIFLDLNASANYTQASYSVNPAQNTHTLVQNYDLVAFYEFPLSFRLTSSYGLQLTGSQGSLPAQAVSFWNASLYKTLFHDQSTQLWFSVFDLLNSVNSYSQFTGVNFVQTTKTNLRGRTFFFGVVYNFRKFPATNSSKQRGS